MGKSPMIIFDIDDTLVNHSAAEKEAAIRFGAEFQNRIPDYSPENFARIWHDASENHIKSFLSGEINFQEQRRRRIRSIFRNNEINNEEADEIFRTYLKFYEDSWELFDDVLEFFNVQNEIDFAVLSDGSQEQQESKLKRTKIHHYFKFIITAESEGLSKPNPKFFLRACEIAGKPASDVYYVGNDLQKDALGALKAGLMGVWLNRTGIRIKEKVDTIQSLAELNRLVLG